MSDEVMRLFNQRVLKLESELAGYKNFAFVVCNVSSLKDVNKTIMQIASNCNIIDEKSVDTVKFP